MTTWTSGVTLPQRVAVEDASQVAGARLLACEEAERAGFAPDLVDSIALASTELAENLHRHAVGGELIVTWDGPDGGAELNLVAVDRGPGVGHFDQCLVDGYSTAGTLGTGLGAVIRRADRFDAVSEPGRGTVVRAAFAGPSQHDRQRLRFDVGAVGFPVRGEIENGDAFAAAQVDTRLTVLLADGLGHGPFAAEASRAASELFAASSEHRPAALLAAINDRLVAGRGAAVSVVSAPAAVFLDGGPLATAGLGNVEIMTVAPDGTTRRIATDHGTLGARLGSVPAERTAELEPGSAVVMHSDGLSTRWTLDDRAELLRHTSLVIAVALWRDHSRGTDDSLIAVIKALPRGAVA